MKKSKKKKKEKSPQARPWIRSIDLHGMRVEEALAELDRFMNRCILDDEVYKVEIVHGIGTGKIKAAVSEYLKTLSVVRSFHLDPLNPLQPTQLFPQLLVPRL